MQAKLGEVRRTVGIGWRECDGLADGEMWIVGVFVVNVVFVVMRLVFWGVEEVLLLGFE